MPLTPDRRTQNLQAIDGQNRDLLREIEELKKQTNKTLILPVENIENVPLCCPFCGKAPVFPAAKDVYGTCYEAGCDACGIASVSLQIVDCFHCTNEHVYDSWDNEKMQYGVEYIEVARRKAIKQWNTRWEGVHSLHAVAAERERCAKLVELLDTTGHDNYIETTGDLCEALASRIRSA